MKHLKKGATALLFLAMVAMAQQRPGNATSPNLPKNLKTYFVVFLMHSSQQPATEAAPDEQLKQAHLAFMRQMTESRKYALGGPFLDHGAIVGVIIANAQSETEARSWESADPLVKALGLRIDVHPAMMPSLDSLKVEY